MFHVEQKPSEEIPRDGSLEKLEFFERAGPFGCGFHFPGQGSRILRARRPGHVLSHETGSSHTIVPRGTVQWSARQPHPRSTERGSVPGTGIRLQYVSRGTKSE